MTLAKLVSRAARAVGVVVLAVSPAAAASTATGSAAPPPSATQSTPTPAVTTAPTSSRSTPAARVTPARSLTPRTAASARTLRPRASSPGPSVYLPAVQPDSARPLRTTVNVPIYVTPASGTTIGTVWLEYALAGTNGWATPPQQAIQATRVGTTSEWVAQLTPANLTNSTPESPNGPYDFRAIAIDSATNQGTSATSTAVVSINAAYVSLQPTGSPVGGSATFTADYDQNSLSGTPPTVTIMACPAGPSCAGNIDETGTTKSPGWTTIATVAPQTDQLGNTAPFVAKVDTSTLTDGYYDLAVVAADSTPQSPPDPFQGGFLENVLIDNTPPTASLSSPSGATVPGLTASAQDAGSGVASVKFEESPAGANAWTTIGVATSPPYTSSFDTRQLADGSYDLRVEATDNAGNTSASPVIRGVAVSNPGTQRFDNLTVTNFVAPATNIQLLGEIAGSPEHETWALGKTNAPPPPRLTQDYTAQGNGQVVLLRYLDSTGWEIADVLRKQGSPFQLNPSSPAAVSGQMTASGEAWIALQQPDPATSQPQYAVFHRVPGGLFELDPAASSTLQPLLSAGGPQIHLGQTASGATYGVLVPPPRLAPSTSVPGVPSPTGPVTVTTKLEFGELTSDASLCGSTPPPCWTVQNMPLPSSYTAPPLSRNPTITLNAADATGPGTGWAALSQTGSSSSLILANFDQSGWHFIPSTGLDALDLTGEFGFGSQQTANSPSPLTLTPDGIRAQNGKVWLSATMLPGNGRIVALYDTASGSVVDSWCSGLQRQSFGCAQPLDLDHPATLPDAAFDTPQGPVADALSTTSRFLNVYEYGSWTSVATPGFGGLPDAQSMFVDPTDGWLVGPNSLARVSAAPPPSPLASWPEANRNPLLSAALPAGQSTTDTQGALAVGLNGTALHYDTAAGWQVDPTPPRARHLGLFGVAFAGPSSAFAVGQEGMILHWDGSAWSEDPQSVSVTTSTLNAVAFGADGQGWAVGGNGTVLHYDGNSWSPEQVDAADVGKSITSVAVAGQDVFAVVGGNLIERSPDGQWQRVSPASLPSPQPPQGSLKLVSGLPDGGLVVAGKSLLIVRQSTSDSLRYAPESFQGIPVALAAFRASSGEVRAFVSVAPPIVALDGTPIDNVGGFPAGDGDLIVQTDSGWHDLSRSQYPAETNVAPGDGVVQPDPVLAVAASADGSHAWAVGGYSGTHAADGIGTDEIISARSAGWLASAIWRYDAGGSAQSTALTSEPPSLPATPGTVSFAFFSSALCKSQCSAVQNAQPDVNLRGATGEIATFAQQPGGPAFAMLGGNARGLNAVDLGRLPGLLSPLGGLPTYAAYGPLDGVPSSANPTTWANVFAQAPAPFGHGGAASGIAPVSAGDPTGPVNKYYSFDASQNGGTLRVIVLDNSQGSLEASASGQTAWLSGQLADAQNAGTPMVVIAAEPLNSNAPFHASDGDAVAAQLAAAGVLGVFTASGGNSAASEPNVVGQIPANADPSAPQIPEYEGATMTYQQPQNNGVTWYDASVNTTSGKLAVNAIPVISSLALEPLNGLSVARSSTLSFKAIGRRPAATIASTPADFKFPGFDQYVEIPSNNCSGCIGPSYKFTSSNPIVGDFVAPSAPGSPYPKLDAAGHPTRSSTSGLFCAFNSGTTTVSVTSGLLSSSLTVTVQAGGFGPPCGTVPGGVSANVVNVPGRVDTHLGGNPNAGAPVPPPAAQVTSTPPAKLALPPPAPAAAPVVPVRAPTPSPAPRAPVLKPAKPVPALAPSPFVPQPSPTFGAPLVVPPLIPPALTPVPPGGATVSAQASARREEKARKHASQSAYTARPAGTSATDWFYPVLGVVSLLALLLTAEGLRPGPRRRPALAEVRDPIRPPRRR